MLVGSLSINGGAYQLTVGMLGFGISLALPFAILAIFPNMIKNLPKSGIWMKKFKITLGFIELALALKFLSNADLVSGWGLLKREVFIFIWLVLSLLLSLYLLGLFKNRGEKNRRRSHRGKDGKSKKYKKLKLNLNDDEEEEMDVV